MYFDPAQHISLLSPTAQAVAGDFDITAFAADVEDDIIRRFTGEDDDGNRVVMLEGYDADPADATTDLRTALRRTIAEVVSHRLLHGDVSKGISFQRIGQVSASFNKGFNPLFPQDWKRRLVSFETGPSVWRV